jgi:protein-S-isoprenylcysteine O-methyltransferase Ste14
VNILYKYRGFISAVFAVLLLVSPTAQAFEMLAIPMFALSVSLRVWARMHIGMHSRGSKLCIPCIVKSGPYSFFKHPLYLSNWLAGVSFAVLHSGFSEICIMLCLIYLMFLLLLSFKENAFLKEMPKESQIHMFKPQIKDFFKAVSSDKWTWFWQFSFIALIFAAHQF